MSKELDARVRTRWPAVPDIVRAAGDAVRPVRSAMVALENSIHEEVAELQAELNRRHRPPPAGADG